MIIAWVVICAIALIVIIVDYTIVRKEGSKAQVLRQEQERLTQEIDQANNSLTQIEKKLTILEGQRQESEDACKHNEQLLSWQEGQITQLNTSINATSAACKLAENSANEKVVALKKKIEEEYSQAVFEAQQTYLALQESLSQDTQTELKNGLQEIQRLEATISREEEKLEDLYSKTRAARELWINAQKQQDEKYFYQLQITADNLHDCALMREWEPELRNPDVIRKLIWKLFYEAPYTALIGRVVGSEKKCGVYKITNLLNGMCYIGQSVDIADRWRTHIKRGLGIEQATTSKLYPAMRECGPENFMFEIVEECPRDKLNEKERYWIDFFGSKDFGYNSTGGNK